MNIDECSKIFYYVLFIFFFFWCCNLVVSCLFIIFCSEYGIIGVV